jgi:hypothetical protein
MCIDSESSVRNAVMLGVVCDVLRYCEYVEMCCDSESSVRCAVILRILCDVV